MGRNMSEASVELLKLVSEPLRVEIHFEVHSTTLFFHPFFDCYNEVNPMGLRQVCHTAVSPLSLSSGDVLFGTREKSQLRMLFVIHGNLLYQRVEFDAQVIKGHQWMCEATL